jgi:hypothetical protein
MTVTQFWSLAACRGWRGLRSPDEGDEFKLQILRKRSAVLPGVPGNPRLAAAAGLTQLGFAFGVPTR